MMITLCGQWVDRGKKDRAMGVQGQCLWVMQKLEGTSEMNLQVSEGGTARQGVGSRGQRSV